MTNRRLKIKNFQSQVCVCTASANLLCTIKPCRNGVKNENRLQRYEYDKKIFKYSGKYNLEVILEAQNNI